MSPRGQSARFTAGGGGLLRRPERPELPPLREIDRRTRRDARRPGPGVGRAHLDPGLEVGDDGVGELRLGGHAKLVVAVADRPDEQALVGVAGHDRGAGVAPEAEGLPAVEPEPAPQLLGRARVALSALRRQDGPDLRLEECLLLRRDGGRRRMSAPGGFSFGVSGLAAAPPGLCGKDLRYSDNERNPSRSVSSRRNIGSIVAAAFRMRGEERRKSRYSSSDSRPSRSASPRTKIRSGSKAGNRCVWAVDPAREQEDDDRYQSGRESRHV